MKQVKYTELIRTTVKELKDGPCLEVTADGKHLAFLVVGTEAEMRGHIKAIASQIDAGRGK